MNDDNKKCSNQSNDKTVLLIAPQPFFAPRGTPINVLNMCRALCEEGYEVHILTLPFGTNVEMCNLIFHRVSALPFLRDVPVGFSFAKLMYNLLIFGRLIRILVRQRFMLIHALEESAFYAVPIAHWFRIPAIVDIDSDVSQQLREQPFRPARWLAKPAQVLRRYALGLANCAIAVSPSLTELVRQESPNTRVFEIQDTPLEELIREPNQDLVEKLRIELGLPGDAVTLVYTGNFDYRQGLPLLIETMPNICAQYPLCRLLLVGGEKAQIEELRRKAKANSLENAIVFAGQKPPTLMPEIMGLSSVLISPRLEPNVTPLKIFAYMASGRPIVATDLPTHTTVIDDGCAVLVPPSVEGMTKGILKVLSEPEWAEQLGRSAQERVHERYSFAKFKHKMNEVYASISKT